MPTFKAGGSLSTIAMLTGVLGPVLFAVLGSVSFIFHEWAIGGWTTEVDPKAEPKNRRSRKKKINVNKKKAGSWISLVGVIFGFVLTGVLGAFILPVVWKWIVWALCAVGILYVALNHPTLTRLRASIRFGFGFLFFSLLTGAFGNTACSQWAQEQAAAMEGELIGAGEVFNDHGQRPFPMVQIGKTGSIFIMTPDGKGPYFQPFQDAEFKVVYGKKGPLVSTTIRDGDGHICATLTANYWRVFAPYCVEKNYTPTALEILDSSWHVVFQLRILPDRVQVQAEWWDNQGRGKRIMLSPKEPNGGMVIPLTRLEKKNDYLISPMFIHPAKDHWGEFTL